MDNRATIEQLVRDRAHELWQEAGRPKGREKCSGQRRASR